MPTNEQRRQAAKRKLERQLANRAARAKRRRIAAVVGSVVVVLLAVGGIYWLASGGDEQTPAADATETSTPPTDSAETTDGPCQYTSTPAEPAAKPVEIPEDPDPTPNTGTVTMTLKTDQGDIPVVLDRAKAPCTVQSTVHLVESKFYEGSKCHRLVNKDNFKVLQCGGQGEDSNGGPGFTIPDEKPTDLAPAPADAAGASVYPRGSIAMANTGAPNSGSSQFFLVFGSTFLPPDYTVFGTIDEAGLAVIDKVGTAGDDGSLEPSPGGGKPNLATTITSATISE